MQPFNLEALTAIDGAAVLSLEQAKAHLAVLDDDEDSVIEGLRDAAIEWVERHCDRSLAPRNWRLQLDRFPPHNCHSRDLRIALTMGPSVIVSVKYLDLAGTLTTLSPSAYVFGREALMPALGTAWPETAELPGAVEIVYTAGLIVPEPLRQAVRLLMGTYYRHRESVGMGSMSEIPHGVLALCLPYKTYHI